MELLESGTLPGSLCMMTTRVQRVRVIVWE